MGLMEKRLKKFFNDVGRSHANGIRNRVKTIIPLMKKHPHITEKEINRFKKYFTDSPAHNHIGALKSLIIIAREVPSVREKIVEYFGSILYQFLPLWKDLEEYKLAKKLLDILELPLSKEDEYYKSIARSIITHNKSVILIIGAGFSYDSMPITNELESLLVELLRNVGVTSPIDLIKNKNERVWKIAKENSNRFKDMFAGWSSKSAISSQHKIVAKMLKQENISHIISFNLGQFNRKGLFKKYRKEY
jgi:hypothetical protein